MPAPTLSPPTLASVALVLRWTLVRCDEVTFCFVVLLCCCVVVLLCCCVVVLYLLYCVGLILSSPLDRAHPKLKVMMSGRRGRRVVVVRTVERSRANEC
jgi:hypothetical protein